jgi:hypothetical protein
MSPRNSTGFEDGGKSVFTSGSRRVLIGSALIRSRPAVSSVRVSPPTAPIERALMSEMGHVWTALD